MNSTQTWRVEKQQYYKYKTKVGELTSDLHFLSVKSVEIYLTEVLSKSLEDYIIYPVTVTVWKNIDTPTPNDYR